MLNTVYSFHDSLIMIFNHRFSNFLIFFIMQHNNNKYCIKHKNHTMKMQ